MSIGTKNKKEADEETWDMDFVRIKSIVQEVKKEGRYHLLENEAREILNAAGLNIAEGKVAYDIEECVEVAEEIGYPVVLKVVSEDIVHKMDVGGVAVDLQDSDEVRDACQAIRSRVRQRKPDTNIRGISVAEMVEGGKEVVIGGMVDQTFGPVVMFGLGGIYVEIFEDVEFRVAPLSIDEAHEMISDIDSFPLLMGARGQKCRDLDALAEMIARVGYLVHHVEEINELDLNPVASLEHGVKALDVAINLK